MLQSPWHISLLGGFAIKQRSRDASESITNQMAMLLAMLADRVGRQCARQELTDELWPEVDGEVARNRFRVLLANARRLLEPAGTPAGSVLSCDRTSVTLLSNACRVDTEGFQSHISKANQSTSTEARIENYKSADALYGGAFMSGKSGDWIEGRRAHFARLQSLAQTRYSAILEESGDIAGAMQQITRAIEADPLREAPRRRALRLLVDAGDVGSALGEYEEYRKLLKKSVGLVPTGEFQDWIKDLRSWAGSRRTAGREPDAPPRSNQAQPLPIASGGRVFLPPALTTFVGRTADIAELSDLLLLYRWITLVGPGGIGKTRLAIEAARSNLPSFGGGVFFVPVGEASTPSVLLETILRQIQIDSSSGPLEALRQYLAQPVADGRNACLFVLDGIDPLSSEANQVILRLLAEIPNATVLATARKGRGAIGEHEFAVRPLEIPEQDSPLDRLVANASVLLFLERAKAASSRFGITRNNARTITDLCRRLEGIPLAIELAAAQSGKSPPADMLQKLSDIGSLADPKNWREPRHRSLQASLAFSLDSLSSKDQRLFCSLCVFRGSFDTSAAAVVAEASPADLGRFAEHSLLHRTADPELKRYAMLDMIREFGWSRLLPSEGAAVQERYASYFRQLVADFETLHLSSGIQPLPRLRLEVENLRVATDWFLNKKDSQASTRLAIGMVSLWIYTGFQQEGRDYIERIRAALQLSELQHAVLDTAEGMLACFQDDPETGRGPILRALPLLEAAGLRPLVAGARWVLGFAAYLAGDYAECLEYATQMEEAIGGYLDRWRAYQRNLSGFAYCELGMLDEADDVLREAQRNWQELGDLVFSDFCRLSLARVTWKRGILSDAWLEYREVAAAFVKWGDRRGFAYAVEGLGRIAAELGRFSTAARLLGSAQRLRESLGLRRDYADERAFAVAASSARTALGSGFDSEWQAGYSVAPDRMQQMLDALACD